MIWLTDVIQGIRKLNAELDLLLQATTSEQLNQQPVPGSWSIAECLKHLTIANTIYLKDINEKLAKAEVKTVEYPIRFSLTGKIFLLFVDPKYKFKVPAPKLFKPQDNNKVENAMKTVHDFKELQRMIIHTAEKACAYDHANIYTYSPLSKLLRFNVGEQFYIMMRHTKRHLLQAQAVHSSLDKTIKKPQILD